MISKIMVLTTSTLFMVIGCLAMFHNTKTTEDLFLGIGVMSIYGLMLISVIIRMFSNEN